jgi:hypothetical protein
MIYYYYKKRGETVFSRPKTVFSGGNLRKPRIAVDAGGKVTVTCENRTTTTNRVKLKTITGFTSISAEKTAGGDNNGGLDADNTGRAHLCWRSSSVNYNTVSVTGQVGSSVQVTPAASDFSDLAVNKFDNSIHVCCEVRNADGIYYTKKPSGSGWTSARKFAVNEVSSVSDPDHVNPAIAATGKGRIYITFSGGSYVPYFFVIDEKGSASSVIKLGTRSGGKYQNGNIHAYPGGGVCMVWSPGAQVFLAVVGNADISTTRLGLSENNLVQTYELTCSPNPFCGRIRIGLMQNADCKMQNAKLQIFDISGKQVHQSLVDGHSALVWDPQNQTTGTYIVKVKTQNAIYSEKIHYIK